MRDDPGGGEENLGFEGPDFLAKIRLISKMEPFGETKKNIPGGIYPRRLG